MHKKLYRSREHRVIAGVLGGLGEYSGTDLMLWRLGFLVLLIATGFAPFGIAYLLAWIILPSAPAGVAPAVPADDAGAV
jgi:phage shock protein C